MDEAILINPPSTIYRKINVSPNKLQLAGDHVAGFSKPLIPFTIGSFIDVGSPSHINKKIPSADAIDPIVPITRAFFCPKFLPIYPIPRIVKRQTGIDVNADTEP